MRVLVLALLAGCTAQNPLYRAASDLDDGAADMARATSGGDGGAVADMTEAGGDDMAIAPGSDLAGGGGDLAAPCGGAGQECCDNGGSINPPICNPNDGHPIGGQLSCNENHSGPGSTCVYCGSLDRPCCVGNTCPNALPSQTLTCKTVAGRDVKYCE